MSWQCPTFFSQRDQGLTAGPRRALLWRKKVLKYHLLFGTSAGSWDVSQYGYVYGLALGPYGALLALTWQRSGNDSPVHVLLLHEDTGMVASYLKGAVLIICLKLGFAWRWLFENINLSPVWPKQPPRSKGRQLWKSPYSRAIGQRGGSWYKHQHGATMWLLNVSTENKHLNECDMYI